MDNSLDELAKNLESTLAKIKSDAESSNGPCRTCKYAHDSNGLADWGSYVKWMHCINPAVADPKFDPVTGKIRYKSVQVSRARDATGLCGPSGMLHDISQTTDKKSFFAKLFS